MRCFCPPLAGVSRSDGGGTHNMDRKHKDKYSHYNSELRGLSHTLRNNMTKSEACLWKYVLRAGMMKGYTFRRQRPIGNYIVDFMCQELGLIIEVDGLTHNSEQAEDADALRQNHLEEQGFTVLRFTSNEVLQHIDSVRNSIELWIDEHLGNPI